MRSQTSHVIIHCSATPPSMDIGVREIDRWHRARGWLKVGYHYVIRRNGDIESGRAVDAHGAHAKGYNAKSVGICMIGGVSESNSKKPDGNFTPEQWVSLLHLVNQTKATYPTAKVIGHNEISNKACPSFNVQEWMATQRLTQPYEAPKSAPVCHTCGQSLPTT